MILWPSDLNRSIAAPAGGKARALAALCDAAVRIPEWFVALPDADVHTVESAVEKLSACARLFAVRSSAVDEDGAAHSFAGQLQTFLRVPAHQVWDHVQAVRASAQSEQVWAYRREHGLALPPPPAAVVIQRMIEPVAAGVAFSADPVSGRRRMCVVAAVRGDGERLVSGEANGDTFLIDDDGNVKARHIAAGESAIDDEVALAVAQLARTTEKFFNRPQDIEWAFDADGLWLLQSRPITTLQDASDPEGPSTIWDNSNIAESYGGITLPLTFTFARRAYEEVYQQFCLMMGVPREKVAENANLFRQMLGSIRGRVYYNLLNWYRVLALLPGFRTNRKFMETMMGVKEPLPEELAQQIASGSAWKDALRLGATVIGMARGHMRLEGDVVRFYRRVNNALGASTPDLSRYRTDELAAYYRRLETKLLTDWRAPLVNDFFAMISYGGLRQLCAQWCGDESGTLQNDLISSQGGVISAEPAARVRRMAELCESDPDLRNVLASGSWPECRAAIAKNTSFAPAFNEYIERFGDRCMDELKLETVTLRDDPLLLLRSIANLAGYQREPQTALLRQQAEQRVKEALKGKALRSTAFRWILQNARKRIVARENLRFERTRVFGRVRLIFVELGRRLYGLGRLHDPADVFYLEVEEVLGFVEGTLPCVDLAGLAAVRRDQYAAFAKEDTPPNRFETRGPANVGKPHAKNGVEPTAGATSWLGMGACPGVVRGRVRVVRDPRNAGLERGEVLVAERTDPGWVLLFPLASGLLVERGSLLSHSAIVARELGLPAIVGLPGITTALHTGEEIEMDGSTGVVRLLSQ